MQREKSATVLLIALAGCAAGPPRGQSAVTGPGGSAAASDPAPPPRADGRLPADVAPKAYRIELTVDPQRPTFLGRVRVELDVRRATRAIVMHARGATVKLASVSQSANKAWAKPSMRMAANGKQEPEELVLVVDRELSPGPAQLDIEYEAVFGAGLRGLYRVEEAGKNYAFTQFEPNDARRAFPCFDEPSYKVPFELAVSVPAGNTVVSNMPVTRTNEQQKAELVTFEFEKSPPLPSYLVALGVGPFDVLEGPDKPVKIRLIATQNKAALGRLAVDAAQKQLELLASYFGSPYPYKKLDLVAVPNFAAGAMENPGFVTFREELVLLDPERAATSSRRALVGVMAHELAHQWFGNLVTMAWWDDIWLNEGFATWMGNKIVDQYDPGFAAVPDAIGRKADVMSVDALSSARKVRQPVRSTSEALEAFDSITYVKGASVLGMVERWLGQETFQSGVRAYLTSHAWSNATARDLFSALDAKSARNVTGVMDGFLDQTGVPQVKLTLDCSAKAAPRVKLEQTEYRPLGSANQAASKLWRFPVCLKQEAGPSKKTQCTLLEGKSAELLLENAHCPRWVFPNADAAGYYRMQLGKDELTSLAKLAPGTLTDEEKIALVSDGWALVKSGELDADAYLELLPALSDKADRVLWEQLITVLGELDRSLVPDAARAEFQRRVTGLVGPAARRHGWDVKPNDGHQARLLRSKLLWALGSLGADAGARKEAALRAERWLKDPNSIDGDIALVAVELHARTAGAALFDALKAKLAAAATPEARLVALKGMTGFDDPKLVERLLGMTLDGSIKMQDLRYVFGPLFERRATRNVAYTWLTQHFSELEKRLPSFIVGRTVWVMASLCNEARVKEAEAFFRPRVERMEGASKHLTQAIEAGRLCAAVAIRQAPSVERWLSPKGRGVQGAGGPAVGVAPVAARPPPFGRTGRPARGVAPTKP